MHAWIRDAKVAVVSTVKNAWPSLAKRQLLYYKIQKKIQPVHGEPIQQLHAYYNSLAPACCLPPEVLAELFAHVTNSTSGRKRDILTVTHVCHYWREVALEFPHLWATVIYDENHGSPELFWLMYERAKDAMLTVSVHLYDCKKEKLDILRHILRQLNRTYELSLTLPVWKLLTIVDIPVSESPSIRHLRLFSLQDLEPMPLPTNIRIHVSRLYSSPIFQGLTHLHLESMSSLSPTLKELWIVLRGAPTLEELLLHEISTNMENLAPSLSWNPDINTVIHLPRIRHINFSDSSATSFAIYSRFFSHVPIPEDAHISLFISMSQLGLQQLATFPLLPPTFLLYQRAVAEGEPEPVHTSLEITLNSLTCIYVRELDHDSRFSPGGCQNASCGRLNAFFDVGNMFTCVSPFSCFRGRPSFVHIRSFKIYQNQQFLYEIPWHDILAALPHLRVLIAHVEEMPLSELVDALLPAGRALHVPLLKVLHLSVEETSQYKHHAERITKTLEQRAQVGARLDTLRVSGFLPASDSVLNRLERVVCDAKGFE